MHRQRNESEKEYLRMQLQQHLATISNAVLESNRPEQAKKDACQQILETNTSHDMSARASVLGALGNCLNGRDS